MAYELSIRKEFEASGLLNWHPKIELTYDKAQKPISKLRRVCRSDNGNLIRLYTENAPDSLLCHTDMANICELFLESRGGTCLPCGELAGGKKVFAEICFSGSHVMNDIDELFDTLVITQDHYENTMHAHCLVRRKLNDCYLPFTRTLPVDLDTSYELDIAPVFRAMHASYEMMHAIQIPTLKSAAFLQSALESILYGQGVNMGEAIGICRTIMLDELTKQETVGALTRWHMYTTLDYYVSAQLPRALMPGEDNDVYLHAALWEPTLTTKRDVLAACMTQDASIVAF